MNFDSYDRSTWVNTKMVGQRIRKLRLKHNLTVQAFSDIVSVAKTTYIYWVLGRNYPSKYAVDAMIEKFHVTLEDIFGYKSKLDEPNYDIDKTYIDTQWHDSKFSAKRINELMARFNVDTNTLAKSLGITPSAVRYWRRGASCPNVYSTDQLVKFFNMTISELIDGE